MLLIYMETDYCDLERNEAQISSRVRWHQGPSKPWHRAVPDALGYRQITSHSWSPWELGKTTSHGNKERKGQIYKQELNIPCMA